MSNLLDMNRHRRRQMKGETPKTEPAGKVFVWAYGEESYDCNLK